MIKRACTECQINERKKEIIDTTNKMFDEMDYQNISMKTIAERISIARSSLYCYYNSKEEIMLDILKDDYCAFLNEIITCFNSKDDSDTLAKSISSVYLNHMRLLKIVSIYLSDIEMHVSIEKLVTFKQNFKELLPSLNKSIKNHFINIDDEGSEVIEHSILMLAHALYPMVKPNENQRLAMEKVGLKIVDDAFSYTYNYLKFLFSKLGE